MDGLGEQGPDARLRTSCRRSEVQVSQPAIGPRHLTVEAWCPAPLSPGSGSRGRQGDATMSRTLARWRHARDPRMVVMSGAVGGVVDGCTGTRPGATWPWRRPGSKTRAEGGATATRSGSDRRRFRKTERWPSTAARLLPPTCGTRPVVIDGSVAVELTGVGCQGGSRLPTGVLRPSWATSCGAPRPGVHRASPLLGRGRRSTHSTRRHRR